MRTSKTTQRAAWARQHKAEIEAARTPESGSSHNAAHRNGMSGGGWGYWVWALTRADIDAGAMPYWSGRNPTPSTAINQGIADYIEANAPRQSPRWMAWEKYTGKILATSASYEALMRRGDAVRGACIGKSDHLPEWAGKAWRKGEVLPLRDAKGRPA